jgi:oxygen-independent coproporphyrinogen-3 oxidase
MRSQLIHALCKEMIARKDETAKPISSIYFGGGSPSILNQTELSLIFKTLTSNFDLSQVQEVTLETNPDDHSTEKLSFWKSLGINRLSIGIQSFIDRDLKLMNRAHSASDAKACVEQARQAGFESLTIDLIYGIPNQSFEEWQANVQQAIALNTDHISAYCLTVEEKTALHHQVKSGAIAEKQDDIMEEEYLFLHRTLSEAGFHHYEISNYAKTGKEAFHNSSYWSGKTYLGFGPSAHSFDGKSTRRWNISNNITYAKAIAEGSEYFETEILSRTDKTNEQIMTALRTAAGLSLNEIESNHKKEILRQAETLSPTLKNCVWQTDSHLGIKPENWLLADAVIRELMV